jgi:hypothetical protein
MFIIHPVDASGNIAELRPGTGTIRSAEDAVDILGNASYANCTKVIIHSASFATGFFDLRTGLAGDILQKFSNYRMRLAIVGDFSHLKSRSWRDFIRESNRGKMVCFMPTVEEAISVLIK